jgi:metallo-beta-lactamase class B
MKRLWIALACALAGGGVVLAQQAGWPASWTAKAEPYRLIGNVHQVGSAGLTALLITTPKGHILLDAGMPSYAPEVARNIEALGFKPRDVRWLLNSHAHFDHSGGLAELKRLTGGKLAAMAQDRPALETGVYPGSEENASLKFPPVTVDRVLKDGEVIELGGVKLSAHLTPGHTAGCTTWTFPVVERGRRLDVLYYCSTSVAANRLVERPQYPGIVGDYRRAFAKLKTMKADVFLAPHGDQYGLDAKRAGLPGSLVDPGELSRRVAASEADFDKQLAAQQQKGAAR